MIAKETPMLFSTPMVIAADNETKIETRRTIGLETFNMDPNEWEFKGINLLPDGKMHACFTPTNPDSVQGIFSASFPYGNLGHLIWVRETFGIHVGKHEPINTISYKAGSFHKDFAQKGCEHYHLKLDEWNDEALAAETKWKPSIHMPKEVARLWLQIRFIGCERLQSITKESAKSEGILLMQKDAAGELYQDYSGKQLGLIDPRESFASLWKSINGVDSWNKNPWVWIIGFKKFKRK